jgi:hypothetical protein
VLPTTVNANGAYSFILYPTQRILNTDVIKITFPVQVILTNGSRNCQASSASDATLKISSCTALNNILTVTVNSTQATLFDFVMKIQVFDGIKNPPSTYSDKFMLYVYDNTSKTKDYNDLIQISYSPGVLGAVTLVSSSNISGAVADLTISFTPGQPILKDGIINITFPWFNQNAGTTSYVSLFPGNVGLKVNSVLITLNLLGFERGNYNSSKFKYY